MLLKMQCIHYHGSCGSQHRYSCTSENCSAVDCNMYWILCYCNVWKSLNSSLFLFELPSIISTVPILVPTLRAIPYCSLTCISPILHPQFLEPNSKIPIWIIMGWQQGWAGTMITTRFDQSSMQGSKPSCWLLCESPFLLGITCFLTGPCFTFLLFLNIVFFGTFLLYVC